jgi:hypothetical protein
MSDIGTRSFSALKGTRSLRKEGFATKDRVATPSV